MNKICWVAPNLQTYYLPRGYVDLSTESDENGGFEPKKENRAAAWTVTVRPCFDALRRTNPNPNCCKNQIGELP